MNPGVIFEVPKLLALETASKLQLGLFVKSQDQETLPTPSVGQLLVLSNADAMGCPFR